MAYEYEIPKELEEGKIYSSKDISYLVGFNKGVVVICEDDNLSIVDDSIKYKVEKKMEAYITQHYNGAKCMNNAKNTIYIIKRIN